MRISVIIATLNSEKTIERAIESVVKQNFIETELIIIDGKSDDDTCKLASQYKDNFTNFCLKSEKDRSIYEAFNKGISLATGDLIGILGSDDMYAPNAFNTLKKSFNLKTEIFYGNIIRFKELNDKNT